MDSYCEICDRDISAAFLVGGVCADCHATHAEDMLSEGETGLAFEHTACARAARDGRAVL